MLRAVGARIQTLEQYHLTNVLLPWPPRESLSDKKVGLHTTEHASILQPCTLSNSLSFDGLPSHPKGKSVICELLMAPFMLPYVNKARGALQCEIAIGSRGVAS